MKQKMIVLGLLVASILFLALSQQSEVPAAISASPASSQAARATPLAALAQSESRIAVSEAAIAPSVSPPTVGQVHLKFSSVIGQEFGLKASLLAATELVNAAGLQQTSDSNNEILWSNLAPGDYRWRLDSQVIVKMAPPFEQRRVTFDARGNAHTNDPPPSDLSGIFSVKAGETTEISAVVENSSTITGVVVEAAQNNALDSIIIRLRHRETFTNPVVKGQDLVVNDTEGSGRPDADGRFILAPVKPGDKVLTVSWRVGQDYYYATQMFTVAPGETRDLGGIYCQPGVSMSGIVRFQTPDGQHIPKEALFGEGVEPKLDMIFNSGSEVPTERGISEYFHPNLDQPFVVHGLAPGDYFVLVDADEGWPATKGGLSISQSKTAEVNFDSRKQSSFEVNLEAEALCQVSLTALVPGSNRAPFIRGVLVNSRQSFVVNLSPSSELQQAAAAQVKVPAGRYELWLRSVPLDQTDPADGFSLQSEILVPFTDASEMTVRMNSANALRVCVLDDAGKPKANSVVMFSPNSLANREKPLWLYNGKTNDKGWVNLGGAIEGQTLSGYKVRETFSASTQPVTVHSR